MGKFNKKYSIAGKKPNEVEKNFKDYVCDKDFFKKPLAKRTANQYRGFLKPANEDFKNLYKENASSDNLFKKGTKDIYSVLKVEKALLNFKIGKTPKIEHQTINHHSSVVKYIEFLRYNLVLEMLDNKLIDKESQYLGFTSNVKIFEALDKGKNEIELNLKGEKTKEKDLTKSPIIVFIYVPQGDNKDTILKGIITKKNDDPKDNKFKFKLTDKFEVTEHDLFISPVKDVYSDHLIVLENLLETPEYLSLLLRDSSTAPKDDKFEPYTKDDFLKEVFLEDGEYETLRSLLLNKKNIILQGAPGVGKTFTAKRLAYSIIGQKDESKLKQIQFHQSYSYEDFIEGYKPQEDGSFKIEPGVFKDFCEEACKDLENKYFFIIDEINRGNISKILGELMMLIEKGYRGEKNAMPLAYTHKPFFVPENVYIIGMMNTADKSLALIDYALRRRFSFYPLKPSLDKVIEYLVNNRNFPEDGTDKLGNLISKIKDINDDIIKDASLGSGFCIGHSYLLDYESGEDVQVWIDSILHYDLEPILREYWIDDDDRYKKMCEKLGI